MGSNEELALRWHLIQAKVFLTMFTQMFGDQWRRHQTEVHITLSVSLMIFQERFGFIL
jgi:hypothetical protein